jgi:uncharacterized protein (DUF2267 family)
MSATGLDVFDSTIQTTNQWLNSITEELGWGDRQLAYHALRATLQAVRDRVTVDMAAHLGAQLPLLVRGIYYEGWKPAKNPVKARTREEFLKLVEERYDQREPVAYDDLTRTVLKTLNKHVTPGQVEGIREMLGEELKTLWPEPEKG